MTIDKNKWKENMICPVCGKSVLVESFDICKVCFWENDEYQFENPDDAGGTNLLSLNDYKKWWSVLESVMPKLFSDYDISQEANATWKYDRLIVPRNNVKAFIDELTKHNISVRLSFHNWAEKFSCSRSKFIGFPYSGKTAAQENNDELLNIIFSSDPIKTCKEYGLKQMVKILKKSKDAQQLWDTLLPNICIEPNPDCVPKL